MQRITRRSVLGAAGTVLHGIGSPAWAQAKPAALVVGVSQYDAMPTLPSAVMDASLMATVFRKLGLQVSLLVNSSQSAFLEGLAQFQLNARSAPLTVIYIAAHGGLEDGQSFLFLKDARSKADRIPETLLLQSVNETPKQKVLFLDCCREVALPGRAPSTALQHYRAGIHVGYATQPGAPALDGGQTYSPFARALQDTLERPGLEITAIARRVRLEVIRATQGQQIPWERSSLISPIVLNPGP